MLVVEGAPTLGGGCRTEQSTLPGFHHDVCSAAHPLAVVSPFFRRFDLPARGVRLLRPEVALAHPLDGGRAGVLRGSVDATAAELGADGPAYRRLVGPLAGNAEALADGVLSSMRRPVRHPLTVAGFLRHGVRSASHVASRLSSEPARALLAGTSAHAMRPLSSPPTAGVGLLLSALGHAVGWPVVEGGSDRIAAAMVDAVRAAGGSFETGRWVSSLDELPPARAVLLDVSPRSLVELAGDRLPPRYRDALARYRYGAGICKVDYALSGAVPWAHDSCRRAGTLHLGGTFEEVAAGEREVAAGRHPDSPFVLVVQAGVVDPRRAPGAQQTLWAYCHVPSGSDRDMSAAITTQIERFAPGFRDVVLDRRVVTAAEEHARNPNYVGGDIGTGMQTLSQTLLRPAPRWNPYRTALPGVYLCSAATPPGPGVHGRCGELAARTALHDLFGIRHAPDVSVAALPPSAAGSVG